MNITFIYVTKDKKHTITIMCNNIMIDYENKAVFLFRHGLLYAFIPFKNMNCFEVYKDNEMIENYYRG